MGDIRTDLEDIEREAIEDYDSVFSDDLIPKEVKDEWSNEFLDDLNNIRTKDINDVYESMDIVLHEMKLETNSEISIDSYLAPSIENIEALDVDESKDRIESMYKTIWQGDGTQEEKENQIKGIEVLKRTIENSEDEETLGKCKYIFDNKLNKNNNTGYENFEDFYKDIKNLNQENNKKVDIEL